MAQTSRLRPCPGRSPIAGLLLSGCLACGPQPKQATQPTGGHTDRSPALSDDFEAHSPGTAPGTPWRSTGDLEVVRGDRAFSGRQSLRLRTRGQWEGRATIEWPGTALPPELADRHFGRLMSFVPVRPPDGVHWNHIILGGQSQASAVMNGEPFTAELALGGMHAGRWLMNFDTPGGYDGTGPKSDCWQDTREQFPAGEWACIEWALDRTARRLEVWVDGVALESATVDGHGQGCVHPWAAEDWAFPRLDHVVLGWMEFGEGAGERELWIDDFALGDRRLGCPKR